MDRVPEGNGASVTIVRSMIDTVLDRSVILGYGAPGLAVRRALPGWPPDPPSMAGKVVLVTGAASGLGLATAVGFAELGASVRVLARNPERAEEAMAAARVRTRHGEIRPVSCDLSSCAELRRFCDRFAETEERLDVLVNNAGVMPQTRAVTEDGIESTFATHVLAPWMLTTGLAPLLEKSAPSRVINVSSGGQYATRIPEGDPESANTEYSPKKFYARTKRQQVVITEILAEELRRKGVHVHAMHPGWVDTAGVRRWMPVFRRVTAPFIRTPEQGADTIVWLGGAPESLATTGLFWHDRRPRPHTYALGAGADGPSARAELRDHVLALAAPPTT